MLKRVYAIRLKEDLPEREKENLITVLENSTDHIPGMNYSSVRPSQGPAPYDLLWVNAFEGQEAYGGYLVHPYHCNVIDHYMYRESPGAAIADIMALRWEDPDNVMVIPGNSSAPASGRANETAVDDMLPDARTPAVPDQGPLVIVEQVEVLPGRTDEYLAALEEHYKPMIEGKGLRQLMCLRTPPGTGEEEICILWEVASWQAFSDYRSFFQFQNEPHSTNWVKLSSSLLKGGRRRIMLPTGQRLL